MKRKAFVLALLLLVLAVPVAVAQVSRTEPRPLLGTSLATLRFENIQFHNVAQDIELGGMLFMPEGDGPFPAVVIIHGAGTSERDNPWYLAATQYLQENGIIVLLPDKRGSEMSGGDWRSASFEDLATDTVAAVEYLKSRTDLPISGIGIVGMSQGGQFSPLVADLSPDVAFVVDVVGTAGTIREQLLYEENHNLRAMGLLPGVSNLVAIPSAWSIRELRQKTFWDAVGDFDPLPYWQTLDVPALVLYGTEDTNVPSLLSARLLHGLNKPNIDVRLYAGSGHKLEDPVGQGNRIFREEALQAIVSFAYSNAR